MGLISASRCVGLIMACPIPTPTRQAEPLRLAAVAGTDITGIKSITGITSITGIRTFWNVSRQKKTPAQSRASVCRRSNGGEPAMQTGNTIKQKRRTPLSSRRGIGQGESQLDDLCLDHAATRGGRNEAFDRGCGCSVRVIQPGVRPEQPARRLKSGT